MIEQLPEFIINGIVQGETGVFRVIGRCGGRSIRLGDRFEAVFRYTAREAPDDFGKPSEREVEKPVALEVKQIQAYGQELAELGPGMTGSLGLSGTGIDSVDSGWVLGQPSHVAASH